MKKLRAPLLALLALGACTDPLPLPVEPVEPVEKVEVYYDAEAITRYSTTMRRELADPALLEFNAEIHGMSVEERTVYVTEGLAVLSEALASTEFAPNAQASQACSSTAQLWWYGTAVMPIPPLFEGQPGEGVARGFTMASRPAQLRTATYGEGGGDWPGGPHYQGPTADRTSPDGQCFWAQLVYTPAFEVRPNDQDCWYIYGESMHEVVKPGPRNEQYSDVLRRECGWNDRF